MNGVYATLFFNIFWIWLFFYFSLDSIKFLKCMIWQPNFFFCFHDLSAPGNDACHRWLSRLNHHFSCENCFEKDCLLGYKIVHTIFVSKKRLWLKGFLRNSQFSFWSICPKASIKTISEYHNHGTCVFGHWKGFGRFEAVTSLDAYQIIKHQILQKLIFSLPDFRRIREKISRLGIFMLVA